MTAKLLNGSRTMEKEYIVKDISFSAGTLGTFGVRKDVDITVDGYRAKGAYLQDCSNFTEVIIVPVIVNQTTMRVFLYRATTGAWSNREVHVVVQYERI